MRASCVCRRPRRSVAAFGLADGQRVAIGRAVGWRDARAHWAPMAPRSPRVELPCAMRSASTVICNGVAHCRSSTISACTGESSFRVVATSSSHRSTLLSRWRHQSTLPNRPRLQCSAFGRSPPPWASETASCLHKQRSQTFRGCLVSPPPCVLHTAVQRYLQGYCQCSSERSTVAVIVDNARLLVPAVAHLICP